MTDSLTIRIMGLPPSVNHGYAISARSGKARMYKTADVKAWQEQVGWSILAAGIPAEVWKDKPLRLMLTIADPKRKVDLSNAVKYTEDAVARTLGFNDRMVDYLSVVRLLEPGPESTEVFVMEDGPCTTTSSR